MRCNVHVHIILIRCMPRRENKKIPAFAGVFLEFVMGSDECTHESNVQIIYNVCY